jgi:NAD(P)-dependent dehydrogenase (short-subunit alcohol dehydrogenase family)
MTGPAKVAIVLGGSGAIGASVVRGLRQMDIEVFSLDLRSPPDPHGVHITCDVTDHDEISAAIRHIERTATAPATAIINSVGIFDAKDEVEFDYARLRYNFEVNSIGPLCAFFEWFDAFGRANGGVVVSVSSASARRPTADIAYGMSKAALDESTRCLARAWAQYGVWVFGLSPGLVTSAMSNSMSQDRRNRLVSESMLGRESRPSEVGALVTSLISSAPQLLSGSIIDASGGIR